MVVTRPTMSYVRSRRSWCSANALSLPLLQDKINFGRMALGRRRGALASTPQLDSVSDEPKLVHAAVWILVRELTALALQVQNALGRQRVDAQRALHLRARASRVRRYEEAVVFECDAAAGQLRVGALGDLHPTPAPRARASHMTFDRDGLVAKALW